MTHDHGTQAFLFIKPSDGSRDLVTAFVATETVSPIAWVCEAGSGVSHADKKFRKRNHAGDHTRKAAVDVHNSWRRRVRERVAEVLRGDVGGVQDKDPLLELRG